MYRGKGQPGLRGWYVFADYCTGRFWAIDPASDELAAPKFALDSNRNISAIAEDSAGELYATDHAGGDSCAWSWTAASAAGPDPQRAR